MAENFHSEEGKTGERIAKVIARSGVCSRRDAEKMIAEGRVAVNGECIGSPALNVSADALITIDGKPVSVQIGLNLTIVGSKDVAKEAAATAETAATAQMNS